ncbi:unnamed protein product, partial [Rotaria magnacalcarata]
FSISSSTLTSSNDGICRGATWNPNGMTVAGSKTQGSELNQLAYPEGLFIDDDGSIFIADRDNHRVIKYVPGASYGQIVAGDNKPGNNSNQLNTLTKVVVSQDGTMFICDRENKRVQRWSKNANHGETIMKNVTCWGLALDIEGSLYVSDMAGHRVMKWPQNQIVAGGNGKGNALNQLANPYHIFVDREQSIFIADKGNNRVLQWKKGETQGTVIAGFNGYGNGVDQLYRPYSVVVDQMKTAYVLEYINLRVTRWFQGEKSSSIIIGGPGFGLGSNQLYFPRDLAFDRQGNLYVADGNNHRIQMFSINKSASESSPSLQASPSNPALLIKCEQLDTEYLDNEPLLSRLVSSEILWCPSIQTVSAEPPKKKTKTRVNPVTRINIKREHRLDLIRSYMQEHPICTLTDLRAAIVSSEREEGLTIHSDRKTLDKLVDEPVMGPARFQTEPKAVLFGILKNTVGSVRSQILGTDFI